MVKRSRGTLQLDFRLQLPRLDFPDGMRDVVAKEFPTVSAPLDRPVASLGDFSAVAAIATDGSKQGE